MTKKKANPEKGGRPTSFTPETIQKLEDAFKIGCTDLEACLAADICAASLYNYQKDNPKFLERKRILKETPVFIARTSVVNAMAEDPDLAMKYLERKKKDEFSTRKEQTGADGGAIKLEANTFNFIPVDSDHGKS